MDSALLRHERERAVKLLKQLISIPSGNPHVSNDNEKQIARFLRDELTESGFQTNLQSITSTYSIPGKPGHRSFTRPNVIARFGGKNGPKLILNGHVDTVSGVNMKRPFEPRVKGDRLYGRGSSDMKGGIAAIVAAAEAMQHSRIAIKGELVLSLVVDEETLGYGTRGFLGQESGDFAVVAEPTENTLGLAQAGYLDFDISCSGESRHGMSTLPNNWASAYLQAADICNRIVDDLALLKTRRVNGMLMETTFNAAPVEPISRPSMAWMTVEDFRLNCLLGLIPGSSVETSEKNAEAALTRVKQHVAQANRRGLRAKITRTDWDIGFTQRSNGYVRRFENAMRKVLGHTRCSYVSSFCDATHFYRANIPTILFGPGKMSQGHSSDEYVSIRQVKDATSVLAYAIENILS